MLARVKPELHGVRVALDCGVWQLCQWMAHEGRINPTIAIELFFEREDDQSLVDVVPQQADASLAPRPELWRDVVNGGDATLFHFTRNAPVEGGGVDDNSEIGSALVSFLNQAMEEPVDLRQTTEDFGDADDGQVSGIDHRVTTDSAHALAADAEEGKFRRCGDSRPRLSGGAQLRWFLSGGMTQSFDQLRTIHFTGGFTRGDENEHGSIVREP